MPTESIRDAADSIQPAPVEVSPGATIAKGAGGRHSTPRDRWDGAWRIVGFVGLVIGLTYVVDSMINFGLRRVRTSTFGVSNKVFSGEANADILISGSSRALSHYDCRIIEKETGLRAFNIGQNGSQTDLQLAVLKSYLRRNTKPKLIIHNLDLFSFATSHEIYDPAQYIPYLKEEAIYSAVRRVYSDAWKWKYLPTYAYVVEDMRLNWLSGIKALFGLHPKEDRVQGYLPRYTPWTGEFERYRQNNPNGVRFEIEPQGVRDLEELVALCTESNVPLLFVYSPEYLEMQRLERNRVEVFGQFRSISERFRVTLWDYSDSPICADQQNFYNSQHLNADGAAKFSSDLASRLHTERAALFQHASQGGRAAASSVSRAERH